MNGTEKQDRAKKRPKAPPRLDAAERRAAGLNLSLREIVERSAYPEAASTVYRWRNGSVDPKLTTFDRVMRAIEARLKIEEDRLRGRLMKASNSAEIAA